MRWLDFLFWHYYCHFDQSKLRTKDADLTGGAIIVLFYTCCTLLGCLLGTLYIFVCKFSFMDTYKAEYLCALVLLIPSFYMCLRYRYYKQKSIVKGKYKQFRDRWGDPEHVSKKNMRILLWYTILSTIGALIYTIVMGTLNKHGYFEGCRLFP